MSKPAEVMPGSDDLENEVIPALDNELIPVQQLPAEQGAALPARQLVTPMDLLVQAQSTNAPPEILDKYMDLHMKWESNEARKAFAVAMAKFKENPPTITKDKSVGYAHRSGDGSTQYSHASLGNICDKIIAGMAAVGISHRWVPEQEGNRIKITCVLTHSAGHSESVSLHGPADDSGKKNQIQAMGSTQTYLERYTLQAITGIAIMDDDDGAIAKSDLAPLIDEKQLSTLTDMLDATESDHQKFLVFYKVSTLEEMGISAFNHAMKSLRKKQEEQNADR